MPTPLALTIVLDVADVQIRFSHNYLGALKVFYNVLYLGAFQVLESGFSHNYLRALPVLESGISQNRLGTLQELDFDISHFYLGTLQVLECEKLCEIAILLSYNFARYETLVGNPTGGGGGVLELSMVDAEPGRQCMQLLIRIEDYHGGPGGNHHHHHQIYSTIHTASN